MQYRYDSKRRLQGVSLNGEDSYLTCTYSGENTDNETATVTLANGVKSTSVKNLHGSITKTTVGSQSVTNTYSTTDQKLEKSVDSVAGTTSYGYNDKGSLTTVSGPGLTESYTYDDDKKTLQSKAVTSGGVTHTYQYGHRLTAAKELESITVDGKVVRPTVDVLGRNTGKTVGTTAQALIGERISYLKYGDHATNLPGTIRYAKNVNGKMTYTDSIQYRYDCMGNIVEIMENGRTSCRYEYDALGRLTREDNTESGKTRTYSYDNNGNILAKYEYALTAKPTAELYLLDSVCTAYSYAENSDQLMAYGAETFAYDAVGNPTTYRGKSATWQLGRQLAAFDGNTFTYNAGGRRTKKNSITFSYDSAGNLIKQSNGLEFFYDHTGIFAIKHGGSTYYCRKNTQNDVRFLLDSSGSVVVKYSYDAWGNCKVLNASGAEITDANHIGNLNPFRYRGYYYDTETKLYYLQSRYYDPEIGRFITIDDISYLDPDAINGLNLYAYCGNNPVNRMDATGHEWWNPFSWDWRAVGNWFGNVFSSIGNFFLNNWDIIVGSVLVAGAIIVSIATFGTATLISGVIAGGIFGAGFGALGAYLNGGDIIQGALTGLFVGVLGGISPWAASAGAAGMSLLNNRANGGKADVFAFISAAISGLTAGYFSSASNQIANLMVNGSNDIFVKATVGVVTGFVYSNHSFVTDKFIELIKGWYKEGR